MDTSGDPSSELFDLIDQLLADEERGTVFPLEHYLARFPGLESEVALEYARFKNPEVSGEGHFEDDPSTSLDAEDSGLVIGPYRVLRELGRGGQGRVFLAQDQRLPRQVALKVLTAGFFSSAAMERFRREAETASRLDHPSICQILETGESDGVPYLAMRYVPGRSLAQVLAGQREAAGPEGGPPELTSQVSERSLRDRLRGVVAFIEQAARAVHVAHEHGIVHRDLKPGNLMVSDDGTPVVLDFGLARDEESTGPTLTIEGDVMGTPSYMSPEQLALDPREVDARTDVYSLGATLYECVTLHPPFEAPTREALYRAIRADAPRDPRRFVPGLSKDLKVILETSLERNRERRYASARDFAEDLRRWQERVPIRARPAPPWLKAQRWTQRNPVLAVLLIALIAGLASTLHLLGRERTALEALRDERERSAPRRHLVELGGLLLGARALVPSTPDLIPALGAWLSDAEGLLKRLADYRQRLALVRAKAEIYGWHDRFHDLFELGNDLAAPARALRDELITLQTQWATSTDDAPLNDRLTRLFSDLETEVPDLRKTYRFEQPTDAQEHTLLSALVSGLLELEVLTPRVAQRIGFAQELARESAHGPSDPWRDVAASVVADPRFSRLTLPPQGGLRPLWKNPASGLWEFLHEESGREVPELDGATGRVRLKEGSGLVLILVPGGTFTMGARVGEAGARDWEGPPHEVTLDPFFISRFELTQSQWGRMRDEDPSRLKNRAWGGLTVGALHPVQWVNWFEARELAVELGLELPTEAQWEFAARGGGSFAWWCGPQEEDLKDAENLADRAFDDEADLKVLNQGHLAWLDDGHAVTSPVGTFRANGFGLQDVGGNVREWCADWDPGRRPYDGVHRPRDGLQLPRSSHQRAVRGGSFRLLSHQARSAYRSNWPSTDRQYDLGFRPVRAIVP